MKTSSLFLGLAFAFILGFSSCAKSDTCYTCTLSSDPSCQVDICNGGTTATNCSGSIQSGNTNEQIKQAYEGAGYTCTAK